METLGTLEMLRVLRVGKMAEEPFSVGEGFQVIYWGMDGVVNAEIDSNKAKYPLDVINGWSTGGQGLPRKVF